MTVATVPDHEAASVANALLGPPIDSHVSRAYRPMHAHATRDPATTTVRLIDATRGSVEWIGPLADLLAANAGEPELGDLLRADTFAVQIGGGAAPAMRVEVVRPTAAVARAIVRGIIRTCKASGNDWGIVDAMTEWSERTRECTPLGAIVRDAQRGVWWNFGHAGDPDSAPSNFADGRTDCQSAHAAERIASRGREWLAHFDALDLLAYEVAPLGI